MEAFGSYIAGEWQSVDESRENINPSDTGDIVGVFARGTEADVDAAVMAARAAQPGWAATSPQVRADILTGISQRLAARADELGELLAREEGKTLVEARGEVVRAAQIFGFFAGEAIRSGGERLPSTRPGVIVDIVREPVGVVVAITPWNFPIAIPAWKVAPALAYGNTVVLKPADVTPRCAAELVAIAADAGLPAGVLNLVLGSGSRLGPALCGHAEVDAITFTGSQAVGLGIASAAAAAQKRVQLEMGGKNPLVVCADADLDIAVDAAVQGAFFSTGQRCTASSRLIVEDAIHDRFVAAVAERVRSLRVGHALDATTQIGPVIDDGQLTSNLAYLAGAQADGVEAIIGGEVLTKATPGYFMAPALVVGTTNDQTINREEIFGPVASVVRAEGYEHALALANDTPFGLSAGICTTSLRLAEHFKAHAEVGMVMVNLPTAGVDPHVPFGGRKKSSYGPREQGSYAKEFFTIVKTAYTRP